MINAYIKSKEHAWAESTKRSELYRLTSLEKVIDGNPLTLWNHIEKTYKPYTRSTIWTRVTEYWDFSHKGSNPYRAWRKTNAKQFKNVYEKKTPKISYEEATEKIDKLPIKEDRVKALQLLKGGLRWSESFTINEEGYVKGKGSKVRKVFVYSTTYSRNYTTFYNALNSVGLKPHDLRKIKATELLKQGMSINDLCHVMGWEDMKTAMSYISASKEDELKEYFK